jgi:hypothetical protein
VLQGVKIPNIATNVLQGVKIPNIAINVLQAVKIPNIATNVLQAVKKSFGWGKSEETVTRKLQIPVVP